MPVNLVSIPYTGIEFVDLPMKGSKCFGRASAVQAYAASGHFRISRMHAFDINIKSAQIPRVKENNNQKKKHQESHTVIYVGLSGMDCKITVFVNCFEYILEGSRGIICRQFAFLTFEELKFKTEFLFVFLWHFIS